jgi:hypothetical protein
MQEPISGQPADDTGLLTQGSAMGQCDTFGVIAGWCSAAHAATVKRLREERGYLRVSANWRAFCNEYPNVSQTQADHIIQLLDEFGADYFEVAQPTPVSPDTYRALAPAIHDGALHCNGPSIEISVENSRRVAAAVAELRPVPSCCQTGPSGLHAAASRATGLREDRRGVRRHFQTGATRRLLAAVH